MIYKPGETAVVKTTSPIEGRSSFTGTLEGYEDGKILIDCEGVRFELPLEMVKRANIIGTVDFK